MADPRPLYTVKEYAEHMRLHEQTVYRLIKRHRLRVVRVGRSIRIVPAIKPVTHTSL